MSSILIIGGNSDISFATAKSGFSSYLDGLRQKLNTTRVLVITVKLAWVDTKMTKGSNLPKFMTSNVNYIDNKIFKAH